MVFISGRMRPTFVTIFMSIFGFLSYDCDYTIFWIFEIKAPGFSCKMIFAPSEKFCGTT